MAESTQPKALAITKLVRDPETGGLMTIYVDAYSGQPLMSLDGYEVYTPDGYLDPASLEQPKTEDKEPTAPTNVVNDTPQEFTKSSRKNSGGDTKDSRGHLDRRGFNAYGPEGKDITDTKLGKIGIGLMGGMGGKVGGAILGGVVGGPIGALVGGLAGGAIGKRAFTNTSPYAKKQAELKEKETEEDTGGLITRGVETARTFIDKMFDGDLSEDDVSPDVPANAPTPSARPADEGPAVAAVSRPDNPLGIGYSHPERGPWDAGLTPETKDAATRLAGTMDNPQISSAYRSPSVNKAVGGAKKSAHTRGLAFDMSTKHMTDDEKQKAVEMARLSGIERIGTYPDGSLHFDMLEGYNPANYDDSIPTVDGTFGMYGRTAKNAINRAPGWFTAGMTQDRFAPTPTARPTDVPSEAFVSQDERTNTGNVRNFTKEAIENSEALVSSLQEKQTEKRDSLTDLAASTGAALTAAVSTPNTGGFGSYARTPDKFSRVDLSTAPPAQMAALGFTDRSPAQLSHMAKTIAGELSGDTLRALAEDDPQAKQEFAGIVSSMENRAASRKFGSLETAVTSNQYDSLKPSNLDVTEANFAKFGGVIEKNLGDFYTGKIKPADYGVTSYYNPDIANPTWGGIMANPMNIGQHKFGVLDGPYDYAPSKSFLAERERLAEAQISDTRGFTPKGPSTFGTVESPGFGRSSINTGGAGFSQRTDRNTFGTSQSPGSGRSSISTGGGGFSQRSDRGSFGTSSSPGVGRSSLSGGGTTRSESTGGRGRGGYAAGGNSSSVSSSESKGGRGRGGYSAGGWGGSSKSSPTNDGGGKSKSPGGGF